MKLVDILARELKAWPKMTEGGTRLEQDINNAVIEGDGCGTVDLFMLSERADDQKGAHVSKSEWQSAVDALNAPKVVEWDGVGLPPVGEKVEVILKDSTLPASLQGWKSGDIVECVAHVCLYGMLSPLFLNRAPFLFSTLRNDCYRPIRTAAKIAAEEREKAVNLMIDVTNIRAGIISDRRAMARQLYDAGYRKEPKPCGS